MISVCDIQIEENELDYEKNYSLELNDLENYFILSIREKILKMK
jgi:hypothetical protein